MRIGEALRKHGLDEHVVAGKFVHVVKKLTGKEAKASGVDKLLVDVLKECSRQIEASNDAAQKAAKEKEAARAPSPDAPVIVQLVHSVERPDRPGAEGSRLMPAR